MRNGFTLIELLAVIVILAIIALIAVPIVLNVIKDSKKSAFKLSINNIVSALDLYEKNLKMEGISVNKIELSCDGISCNITKLLNRNNSEIEIENDKLNVTGKIFNGSIILSSVEGNLKYDYALNDGEYCAHKYSQDKEMEITNYREGYCEINIPTDSSCFTINDFEGGVVIKDYNNDCPKDVVIPKMIEGKFVIKLDDWAFYDNKLTSIIIPNTVINISNTAFSKNQLSDNQAYIYARTDENNDGIAEIDYTKIISYGGASTNITIPDNVKIIGSGAFYGNNLINVEFSENVEKIEGSAFLRNKLKSVIIPSNISFIGESAFEANVLENIVIMDGVKSIGFSAFYGNNLTSIVIPSSVETIGKWAFTSNKLLTEITIEGDTSRFCDKWSNIGLSTNIQSYETYCG